MDMKEVLSYSLGPVPWSLAMAESAMTKTAKSNLLPLLGGAVPPVEQPPSDAVNIVDGMAMLQKFKGLPETFGELAEQLLRQVVTRLHATSRIDLVFDCYRDSSIKGFERSRRAGPGADVLRFAIAGSLTKYLKQWSKALHFSCNKMADVTFLVDEWQRGKYAPLMGATPFSSPLVSSAGCFARVRVMAIHFNSFVCKAGVFSRIG